MAATQNGIPVPRRRPFGRPAHLLPLLLLLAGCAGSEHRSELQQCLGEGCQHRNAPGDTAAADQYTIACPDVLEIRVEGRPDLSGRVVVRPDGRVRLGNLGEPRLEGETVHTAGVEVARLAGVLPGQVRVRVVGYNSRRVFLFGPVRGVPRAVDYRGPETVLAMLQRAGGLEPGAKLNEIHVVRPNVAAGAPPQVFPIDVEAIVLDDDHRTNLRLRPFDQVYVGETRRSLLLKIIPPWLRPAFKAVCAFCPSPNAMRRRP